MSNLSNRGKADIFAGNLPPLLPALAVIEKCFGNSPEFKKWSPKLKDGVVI